MRKKRKKVILIKIYGIGIAFDNILFLKSGFFQAQKNNKSIRTNARCRCCFFGLVCRVVAKNEPMGVQYS